MSVAGFARIQPVWVIERRGTDITLTADEQLVFDALLRERRLPGGSVVLLDDSDDSSRT